MKDFTKLGGSDYQTLVNAVDKMKVMKYFSTRTEYENDETYQSWFGTYFEDYVRQAVNEKLDYNFSDEYEITKGRLQAHLDGFDLENKTFLEIKTGNYVGCDQLEFYNYMSGCDGLLVRLDREYLDTIMCRDYDFSIYDTYYNEPKELLELLERYDFKKIILDNWHLLIRTSNYNFSKKIENKVEKRIKEFKEIWKKENKEQ